jgi:porin
MTTMQMGRMFVALGVFAVVGPAPGARAEPEAPLEAPPKAPEASAEPPAAQGWADGDHLTGGWGGVRNSLADHGVTIDVTYASDAFTAHGHAAVLGHVDAALTLDSHKLGLWDGGTLYVLGQNNHGSGINEDVGSAQTVTNLEATPYTQLTELFVEQTAFDERIKVRIGKQDANRDFGTPRFGGNFINNNFGMLPNAPLPSYPTTGLGALVAVVPAAWLTAKAAIFEGSPEVGGLGLTTAFRDGGGATLVGNLATTHHFGPASRDGGTTSVGAWWQSVDVSEVGVPGDMARTFGDNAGFFVQNDERIYLHPDDPNDPRGLTVILRFSWAQPDRNEIRRYAGGSAAWHGIGPRTNDTTGVGAGYLALAAPLGGGSGPSSEWFFEAFYKLRLTNFVSMQPDLQWFRHPGGDGRDALVAGIRLKLKL